MLEIQLITTENAMRRHVQWNWVWSSKLDLFMVLLELAYAFCNISKHLSINIRQASWLSVAVCASNFSNGICDNEKIAIYLTLNGKIHLNMSRIYIFCIFSTQQKQNRPFSPWTNISFPIAIWCLLNRCECHFHWHYKVYLIQMNIQIYFKTIYLMIQSRYSSG